jgi:hypothetical protein
MQSRGSPARRLAWLVPLAAVLVLGLVPAASGGGLDRRVADTWFQTIRFPDGGSARIVVSTKPVPPGPGEGIDLGTVVAAGGNARSDVQLAALDAAPVGSAAPRLGTNAAGGSGSKTAYGWVKYTSYAGIELWRWIHQISWSYAGYRVTSVYGQYAGSLNSCCLWDYQGLTSQSHGAPGGPNFTAFAQGKYRQCLTSILCQSTSPWVWLQGNGNGILTGFSWGVG